MKKFISINSKKFKEYLENNYISQSAINRYLNRSDSYMSNVLKNKSMNAEEYLAVCEALEVDPLEFVINRSMLNGVKPTNIINKNEVLKGDIKIKVNYTKLREFLKDNKISRAILSNETKISYSMLNKLFEKECEMSIFDFLNICDVYHLDYLEYTDDINVYDIYKYKYNIANGYINVNGKLIRDSIAKHKKKESSISAELYKNPSKLSTNLNSNRLEKVILEAICRDIDEDSNTFIIENKIFKEYNKYCIDLFGENIKEESITTTSINVKEEVKEPVVEKENTLTETLTNTLDTSKKMTLNLDGTNKEYILIDSSNYQENIDKIKEAISELEKRLENIKAMF